MGIKQCVPPIPVYIPDKGKGLAHFVIDYGIEDNLYWVVFMDDTGECWTFPNPKIRAQRNITYGRTLDAPCIRKESEDEKRLF
jgi:hypothetical protein